MSDDVSVREHLKIDRERLETQTFPPESIVGVVDLTRVSLVVGNFYVTLDRLLGRLVGGLLEGFGGRLHATLLSLKMLIWLFVLLPWFCGNRDECSCHSNEREP